MNQQEIQNILPHRDAMLLIDEAYCKDGVAYGQKSITADEWFLKGHFPENPIVPGVILCEIMAQSACVLLNDKIKSNNIPLFTGLNNVKFKNSVKPGDTFKTECVITKDRHPFYFASGKGFVNGKLCVTADFSFAVTEKAV